MVLNEIENYMTLQISMCIEIDSFKDEEKIINDCRRIHREGKDELVHHIISKSGNNSGFKLWQM